MSATRVKVGGWQRHLEGWPGAVVALSVAGMGVLMGTPQAVTPEDMPLPVPDMSRLAATAEEDARQAAAMASSPDDEKSGAGFELRELGGLLRSYNEADAGEDQMAMAEVRPKLLRAAYNLTLRDGVAPLLRLRAYQQQRFLRELASWEATGKASEELKQVGGGVVKLIEASGWAKPRRFAAGRAARSALFKRRFAEVLGLLSRPELAPTLDEGRALYAFLLSSPPSGAQPWAFRLRKADELAAIDPGYPRKLARGVALLKMNQGAAAVVELREHLAASPDGPYTLRARNYLAAAVELAERQGGSML